MLANGFWSIYTHFSNTIEAGFESYIYEQAIIDWNG